MNRPSIFKTLAVLALAFIAGAALAHPDAAAAIAQLKAMGLTVEVLSGDVAGPVLRAAIDRADKAESELAELRARPVLTVEALTEAIGATTSIGTGTRGRAIAGDILAVLGPVTLPSPDLAHALVDKLEHAPVFLDHVVRRNPWLVEILHPGQRGRPVFHAGVMQHQHVERLQPLVKVGARGLDDLKRHGPILSPTGASGKRRFRRIMITPTPPSATAAPIISFAVSGSPSSRPQPRSCSGRSVLLFP